MSLSAEGSRAAFRDFYLIDWFQSIATPPISPEVRKPYGLYFGYRATLTIKVLHAIINANRNKQE